MKYVSLMLVAVCVAVFIAQNVYEPLTDDFLLLSSDVLARPWIIVTSIFLHGSVEHLFYNMFALALFGAVLEGLIGTRRFLLVFFVTGILAGMGSTFLYEAALGASGAIFGIIGCLAAIRPKMAMWVWGVPMPMYVAAIFWAFLDIIGLFMPSGTANFAHLIGIAAGFLYGYMIRKEFPVARRVVYKTLNENDLDKWEERWM